MYEIRCKCGKKACTALYFYKDREVWVVFPFNAGVAVLLDRSETCAFASAKMDCGVWDATSVVERLKTAMKKW